MTNHAFRGGARREWVHVGRIQAPHATQAAMAEQDPTTAARPLTGPAARPSTAQEPSPDFSDVFVDLSRRKAGRQVIGPDSEELPPHVETHAVPVQRLARSPEPVHTPEFFGCPEIFSDLDPELIPTSADALPAVAEAPPLPPSATPFSNGSPPPAAQADDESTTAASLLSPGTCIGEYALVEPLGQVAGWPCWLARHQMWQDRVVSVLAIEDRRVAEELAAHLGMLARLEHPRIARCILVEAGEPIPIAIEEHLADAYDLRSLMQMGTLDCNVAIEIFVQVLDALCAAQKLDIAHLELRPEYVLVRVSEPDDPANAPAPVSVEAKLGRFGLAAARLACGNPLENTPYMPPELRKSGQAALQSDIFSLGLMLFEMLTGALPEGRESITDLRPDAPAWTDDIFARCFTRLDKRCPSLNDLREAVLAARRPASLQPAPPPIPPAADDPALHPSEPPPAFPTAPQPAANATGRPLREPSRKPIPPRPVRAADGSENARPRPIGAPGPLQHEATPPPATPSSRPPAPPAQPPKTPAWKIARERLAAQGVSFQERVDAAQPPAPPVAQQASGPVESSAAQPPSVPPPPPPRSQPGADLDNGASHAGGLRERAARPLRPATVSYVEILPGGLDAMGNIAGITRSTQGHRRVMTEVRNAVRAHAGRSVEQFWAGVWGHLAGCLRVDCVYLLEHLEQLSGTDFAFMRVLFSAPAVDVPEDDARDNELNIYKAAMGKTTSARREKLPLPEPYREAAVWRVPRSLEAQNFNPRASQAHLYEVRQVAHDLAKETRLGPRPAGSNHCQILPLPARRYFLGIFRRDAIEPFGVFDELFMVIHERLAQPLADLVEHCSAKLDAHAVDPGPDTSRISVRCSKLAVLHKSADSRRSLVLARDVVSSVQSWWAGDALGLFTVDGLDGPELTWATQHVQALCDVRNAVGKHGEKLLNVLLNWHQRVWAAARQVGRPLRVSGSVLIREADHCTVASVGTGSVIIQILPSAKDPIRFVLPTQNEAFIGHCPDLDNIIYSQKDLAPADQLTVNHFARGVSRLHTPRGSLLVVLTPGWLSQHEPGNVLARYRVEHFLQALREAVHAGTIRHPNDLAKALSAGTSQLEVTAEDATLAVLRI